MQTKAELKKKKKLGWSMFDLDVTQTSGCKHINKHASRAPNQVGCGENPLALMNQSKARV